MGVMWHLEKGSVEVHDAFKFTMQYGESCPDEGSVVFLPTKTPDFIPFAGPL